MKRVKTYMAMCSLALLSFSCTGETDIVGEGGISSGKVLMSIEVSAPAISNNALTRTISADNESSLNGDFVLFAFDGEDDDSNFLWEICTGDNNVQSNLQGTDSYDDNRNTPSITWHPDGEGGRLYIEADEHEDSICIIALANVDIETARELRQTLYANKSITRKDVVDSLYVFDFEANIDSAQISKMNSDLKYIPMAGKVTLSDGIQLGAKGKLQLRRSLAKITVAFNWNEDYYRANDLKSSTFGEFVENGLKCFEPKKIVAVYVNNYATVYSDVEGEPNISTNANRDSTQKVVVTVPKPKYDASSNSWSTSVDLYVPETINSKLSAFRDNVDTPFPDGRISVMIEGEFHETDNSLMYCWYRLDLIPAEGSTDELDYLLRNNQYKFTLTNISKRGSGGTIAEDSPITGFYMALGLSKPDNYRQDGTTVGKLVVIDNDDILSVTTDYDNVDDDGVPYYIGVSSTEVEIADTLNAVARVDVVTNIVGEYLQDGGWTIDLSSIPSTEGDADNLFGNPAFSFIFDSDSHTLWIWLDYPDLVGVGETYSFYITAGNIRKRMKIKVVAADTT